MTVVVLGLFRMPMAGRSVLKDATVLPSPRPKLRDPADANTDSDLGKR